MILALLLFAASFDGEAALRHAAKLASLGPHPWGSARNSFAAQYVAAQFREAGLSEVRLQEFESHGIKGANVIGTLRARGPEFIVVSAHHDTVPDAPGAYDDGGGVGVLLEAARALARGGDRPRTIVFISFDGEEAWSTRLTTTAGSRAYLKALGPDARNLCAALVIEMCGWNKGSPVLHAIAYPAPLVTAPPLIAPGWLVRAAVRGTRDAGVPFDIGDPLIPWLYQPSVRAFHAVFYGDDLSFLQNGVPAVFVSDSSFTAFYPWYHRPADTADRLDAGQLARVGRGVLGIVAALGREPRGPASDPIWFAAFGRVHGPWVLWALGLASLVPGFLGRSPGRGPLGARLAHAGAFAVLLWRQPIPALWVFLLPNLTSAGRRRWSLVFLALLPALSLVGLAAVARYRGFVDGSWIRLWEAGLAACALALLWVRPSGPRRAVSRKAARRSAAVLLFGWMTAAVSGEAAEPTLLRVGMDTRTPPWSFVPGEDYSQDDFGQTPEVSEGRLMRLVGLDVDVANALARRLSATLKIVPSSWFDLERGLLEKRYDLIVNGWTPNPKTSPEIVATTPYYEWGLVIAVRSENQRVRSYQDLSGVVVAHYRDPSVERTLRSIGASRLLARDSPERLFEDLRTRVAEAVVFDSLYVRWRAANDHAFKVVGEPLNRLGYHVGVRKQDARLFERVEAATRDLAASREIGEIRRKWEGR